MKTSLKIVFILIILFANAPFHTFAQHDDGVPVSGKAAVLLDQESGRILFEKNAHDPRKIASITKIMTTILAIESEEMEEMVEVSENASGVEGSSLFLKPGEKIKLKDLATGLMLRSGNDAAVAIAEHVGGSLDGFIYLMNEKAEDIGMQNTQFTNPHGLDDENNHYSTAYDMGRLMKYAMNNETFRDITGTKRYKAPQEGEKWDRVWQNKNKLLTSLYEYSTGGKTGYTKAAGRTLVSTAEKNDMSLVAVTLDAPSDWKDHIAMFDWGFESFDLMQLAENKENIQVEGKRDGRFFLPHAYYYPLAEEEKEKLEKNITLKEDYLEHNQTISPAGKVTWSIDDKSIYSMPVMYEKEREENKGFFSKLFRFFTRGD
ncbi:D-alanyl-D-alanine carboxypeptidase [Salibacterium salarium]|uniref:serine-type D-Ala-D-Ala carboxypeptidase n=1 Tax=Salibacterium salarium TaxID=284579 RepID=A0A428N0W4_9BACI|nr:D-alanyl-D-alanine carboxypeptidase family protein [Salibacterium salarium]RSL32050.1 D-alanyl-D-alanine carboxypeptidase [Salibacterium salarium]